MGKAIAIALQQDNALTSATQSIVNFLRLIVDYMYGTPERAKYTYAFAIGLMILSCVLQLTNVNACSHDTLVSPL